MTNDSQQCTESILVTGGAGFIGSNYLNLFVPKNPTIRYVNIDALTYAADLANVTIADLPNYVFEEADIRNLDRLRAIFVTYQPTGIIHFAAESHVDLSIKDPNIFIETNVIGTNNLLSLAKEFGVGRFVHISTDEVYGALGPNDEAFTEETPLSPRNPYSASKAAAELMAMAYHRTYGLPVMVTRSSNNYGPRQDTTKLIPLFCTRLLTGETVPLYGKGLNVRDWLYVEDNVRAIDTVFRRGMPGEVYNIGGNCEKTNIEVTRTLVALAGRDDTAIVSVEDRLGHDFRYALESKKIERELGWTPAMTFDEGIGRTFAYYQERVQQKS